MIRNKKQKSLATGGIQTRKIRTFAEKVRSKRNVVICPICGEELRAIRYIRSEGDQRFKDTKVQVCGCNREEIYGS